MCDVVTLVMCAMYWVLQFVSCKLHWFCHCIVTKSVKNHLYKNMLNITIKVNAYGCRPENGIIPFMYSGTNWCILWWELLISLFMHTWICSIILRHLVNTVHFSSVALSTWIRNVFGLRIDENSIRPEMVISTFCWSVSFCSIWCGGICNACNVLSILC